MLGIALGAGFALYTGRAQDFFLPGILKNVGLGAVYAITALVRWPLVGVLLGFMLGEDLTGVGCGRGMRVYQQATWSGRGCSRCAPSSRAGSTRRDRRPARVRQRRARAAAVRARVGLTWLLVRRVPAAEAAEEPTRDEPVRAEAARD